MHRRVKSNVKYKKLGICSRWAGSEGFVNFLSDMGNKPDGYSLDRIDNNNGYYPENCRWAGRVTQNMNKSCKPNTSSNFKGVNKRKSGRFTASLTFNKVYYHIGTFDSPEIAARAYDAKLFEVCGIDFPTKFNFTDEYIK